MARPQIGGITPTVKVPWTTPPRPDQLLAGDTPEFARMPLSHGKPVQPVVGRLALKRRGYAWPLSTKPPVAGQAPAIVLSVPRRRLFPRDAQTGFSVATPDCRGIVYDNPALDDRQEGTCIDFASRTQEFCDVDFWYDWAPLSERALVTPHPVLDRLRTPLNNGTTTTYYTFPSAAAVGTRWDGKPLYPTDSDGNRVPGSLRVTAWCDWLYASYSADFAVQVQLSVTVKWDAATRHLSLSCLPGGATPAISYRLAADSGPLTPYTGPVTLETSPAAVQVYATKSGYRPTGYLIAPEIIIGEDDAEITPSYEEILAPPIPLSALFGGGSERVAMHLDDGAVTPDADWYVAPGASGDGRTPGNPADFGTVIGIREPASESPSAYVAADKARSQWMAPGLAQTGQKVWVSRGTVKLPLGDVNTYYQPRPGVSIYGGFDRDFRRRDIAALKTVVENSLWEDPEKNWSRNLRANMNIIRFEGSGSSVDGLYFVANTRANDWSSSTPSLLSGKGTAASCSFSCAGGGGGYFSVGLGGTNLNQCDINLVGASINIGFENNAVGQLTDCRVTARLEVDASFTDLYLATYGGLSGFIPSWVASMGLAVGRMRRGHINVDCAPYESIDVEFAASGGRYFASLGSRFDITIAHGREYSLSVSGQAGNTSAAADNPGYTSGGSCVMTIQGGIALRKTNIDMRGGLGGCGQGCARLTLGELFVAGKASVSLAGGANSHYFNYVNATRLKIAGTASLSISPSPLDDTQSLNSFNPSSSAWEMYFASPGRFWEVA